MKLNLLLIVIVHKQPGDSSNICIFIITSTLAFIIDGAIRNKEFLSDYFKYQQK